jgi:cytochrome P450
MSVLILSIYISSGVPHRLMSDDMHMGYRIPAGSIVIANIWSMLHCADTYANPMSFNPDRFLGAQPEHDPQEICFGFGRRVCPGQQLADASVWLSCALALSSLSIRPIKDSDGNPVLPEPVMMSGTISHPKPFKCDITPRSEHARSLIMATAYADDVTA